MDDETLCRLERYAENGLDDGAGLVEHPQDVRALLDSHAAQAKRIRELEAENRAVRKVLVGETNKEILRCKTAEAERDQLRAKVAELEADVHAAKQLADDLCERGTELEHALVLKSELFAAVLRPTAAQERDELRAVVERVRELAVGWRTWSRGLVPSGDGLIATVTDMVDELDELLPPKADQ